MSARSLICHAAWTSRSGTIPRRHVAFWILHHTLQIVQQMWKSACHPIPGMRGSDWFRRTEIGTGYSYQDDAGLLLGYHTCISHGDASQGPPPGMGWRLKKLLFLA